MEVEFRISFRSRFQITTWKGRQKYFTGKTRKCMNLLKGISPMSRNAVEI
jgi:hypothetical protein